MLSYAQKRDSIQFSLLTCSPGTEIYSLFGHTAIRYQNYTQNKDIVFNYGMFSFSSPNFIYRFVKGETDYQLGVNDFRSFEAEYMFRGSSVYQQILNLTYEEKLKLQNLLFTNYLPQNRVYRYNYFYDNCTTRARDQIEKCIDGDVEYPNSVPDKTFRGIIHEFTKGFDWEEFGIDLCLGAGADKPIGIRQQMFSPFYMRSFAESAFIKDENGNTRPLVLKEEVIVDADTVDAAESSFSFSPIACATFFLFLNVVIAFVQIVRKKIYWFWDLILYLSQGLAGCIIAFLFFFSTHPTVDSNWLILLFNPIPLFYLPFMVYNDIKRKKDKWHVINSVYLTLFILILPLIPQEINLSVLLLALGLLFNAVSHQIVYRK
ncbi:DUF4105 domain-containing protein [Bacteroides caecigallinarum]|nr:DUF4105 domain-containing protein [Bacteroides sp. ET336]MCR8894778.1 DUF4105 domain-containing protein [Bacteroides sp. ET336]MDN0059274.1 DUF4105 domain-containing protein [Bacteroides caecigallinarum]